MYEFNNGNKHNIYKKNIKKYKLLHEYSMYMEYGSQLYMLVICVKFKAKTFKNKKRD